VANALTLYLVGIKNIKDCPGGKGEVRSFHMSIFVSTPEFHLEKESRESHGNGLGEKEERLSTT